MAYTESNKPFFLFIANKRIDLRVKTRRVMVVCKLDSLNAYNHGGFQGRGLWRNGWDWI